MTFTSNTFGNNSSTREEDNEMIKRTTRNAARERILEVYKRPRPVKEITQGTLSIEAATDANKFALRV